MSFNTSILVRSLLGLSLTSAVTAAPFLSVAAHAQSASHIYELNGTYADSLGGPALSPGVSVMGTSGVGFPQNSLLSLSGGFADPANYSLEMYFRLDKVSDYNKLLDFKNRTSDDGLYVRNGGLHFFGSVYEPAPVVSANTMTHLVLTRDATTQNVNIYINGNTNPALSFNDAPNQLANLNGPDNVLYFFTDDTRTGGFETSAGSVDYIRTYNTALTSTQAASVYNANVVGVTVPEPSTFALFGSVPLLGFGIVLRRRKSAAR